MDGPGAGFREVAVVGLGLIGGSVAAALRERAPATRILGLDWPDVCRRAHARGLIDMTCSSPSALESADLVVLATPIDVTLRLLEDSALIRCRGVVTDTGSTKRRIMAAAAAAGLPRFVGGHPMAGAARNGLEAAEAGLFEGRPWLLVSRDADGGDVSAVAAFVAALGAEPAVVDADFHDRAMAYVSHAPQVLSTALMRAAGAACGDEGLAMAGPAFLEMTRVAASSAALWQGILDTNADNVAAAIRGILAACPAESELRNREALGAAFESANDWRARLELLHPSLRSS